MERLGGRIGSEMNGIMSRLIGKSKTYNCTFIIYCDI